MEDRITAGLYLELTDGPIDAYTARRVPEVLTLDGVTRATWWENVRRDRDDLPRKLPEFSYLAVYEVDAGFRAPARFMHFYEMDTDDPDRAFTAMTPLVTELLGADTPEWRRWAHHPALRIMYVNTFRRLGQTP